MEKGENLPKLRRMCRIGSWAVIPIIVVAALILIGCCIETAISLADYRFTIEPMDNRGTVIYGLCSTIAMVACFWCLVTGYHLLRSISENESPFIPENVIRIREIAVALLASFAVIILAQVLLALTLDPKLYLFDVPLHMLVSGIVCYLFYLIFDYGTALQTESDDLL